MPAPWLSRRLCRRDDSKKNAVRNRQRASVNEIGRGQFCGQSYKIAPDVDGTVGWREIQIPGGANPWYTGGRVSRRKARRRAWKALRKSSFLRLSAVVPSQSLTDAR